MFETDAGNLVLESSEAKATDRKLLFQKGRKAAEIFDTIASVNKPFYLAKPLEKGLRGVLSDNSKGGK